MKTAVLTDTNSGIRPEEARRWGIHIIPMPFYIDEKLYYEDIDLTQDEFYRKLSEEANISTSQPNILDITNTWDRLLAEYDEVVFIPMSSGLSGTCQTASAIAEDYDGRVQVVDNRRISLSQKESALDAVRLVQEGRSAAEIKAFLEQDAANSSIYIMLDTLYYLKKGGRITPAAAALGTLLRLKPVLQIQGSKLDAYAKARSSRQGCKLMIDAVKSDAVNRFGSNENGDGLTISVAYTGTDTTAAEAFAEEIKEAFGGHEIKFIDPLSLSISCHIGPGALAIVCCKKDPSI